jgi:hypothetical protein
MPVKGGLLTRILRYPVTTHRLQNMNSKVLKPAQDRLSMNARARPRGILSSISIRSGEGPAGAPRSLMERLAMQSDADGDEARMARHFATC